MNSFSKNTFLLLLFIILIYSCSENEKIKVLNTIIETENNNISVQFALADTLMKKAKFDSSNSILLSIATNSLKDSSWEIYLEAQNKIAGNFSETGKYDSMRVVLDKVIELADEHLDAINLISAQAYYAYGIYFVNQSKYDSAKIFLNKALSYRKKLLDKNSPEIGDIYNVFGNIDFYTQNNISALKYYQLSLKLLLNRGFYNKKVGLVYMNLGLVYDNTYQFDKAKLYLDTALIIEKKILAPNHPILAQIEINKMSSFANSGELDSAISAGNNALKLLSSRFGSKHPYIGLIYNNLGMCYGTYGDNENALVYFSKAKDLYESINSNALNQLVKSYAALGNLYLSEEKYTTAKDYFEKALKIMERENSQNIYESSQIQKLLAVCYAKLGKNIKAINTIEKSINEWKKKKEINKMELNKTEIFYSQVLNITGNFDKAVTIANKKIEFFKNTKNINYLFFSYSQLAEAYLKKLNYSKVFEIYKKIFVYFPINKNTQLVDAKKIISYYELERHILSILNSTANAAISAYNQIRDEKYLAISKEVSEILIQLFFENYEKIIVEKSKFIESKKYKEDIYLAILAALNRYNIAKDKESFEHALKLAEFNKSISLLQSLNEKDALSKLSIPPKELIYLQKLRSSILFFKRNLYSEDLESVDSVEIKYYKNRLFDLRNEYKKYKSKLTKNYPKLNSLLKIDLEISIDFIRNSLLDEDQTAIEYYLHNNQLIAFVISNDDFFITQMEISNGLSSTITKLIESINNNKRKDFINLSNKLYNELFSNLDDKIKTNRILIIPDGVLGFVPFDALLYKLPAFESDYRNLPYLLNKYSIGYAYSLNILSKIKGGEKVVSNFLGLAPFNSKLTEFD